MKKAIIGAIVVILIASGIYLIRPQSGLGTIIQQNKLPDLTIEQFEVNEKFAVAVVKNIGGSVAKSAGVEYFLGEGKLPSQQFTPDLAPGESFQVAPSKGKADRVFVDYYNMVAEKNELNNERATQ